MNNSVKLPPEFKERMKNLLGKEFEDYILALNEPNIKGQGENICTERCNFLKSSKEI